ncbi:MAG TPA: aldo/keto reductase [Terriglobia bacterium]|nr:aldo/keto reductase [Terriglobia bacterium]
MALKSQNSSRRQFLASALALPAVRLDLMGTPPLGALPDRPSPLPVRVLGKTGLKVTTLGFGCAWTSDPSVFTRGLDLGINHFDTAPVYQGGNNEPMLRTGLGNRRKQIVLSTKIEARTKDEALQQLENSLKFLGTDYVDIWYLHGADRPERISQDLVEAQATAKRQGKVRFIGVSTHRVALVTPSILQLGNMDVVLTAYNFTMGPEVEKAIESLHHAGMGLVEMKAMAGGRANSRWPGQDSLPRLFQRPGVPGASLRWVLKNSMFASALVGMLSMEEVEENVEHCLKPFTEADQKVLAARLEEIRPVYCRMCGACDGQCPKGLPIPDMLRYAMYADTYRQFPTARQYFQQLPKSLRQVQCKDCSSCAVRCPNGVAVRQRLALAQEWLA